MVEITTERVQQENNMDIIKVNYNPIVQTGIFYNSIVEDTLQLLKLLKDRKVTNITIK